VICFPAEKTPLAEVKEFYTEHHSTIFYVVYSSFCYVETSILERVNRGKGYSEPHLKDLLEVVLPALEVCKCTTGGKQQLKTHVCLGFV